MKIKESDIRTIPRQAMNGFMSLGIIEDEGRFFCVQVEPQFGAQQPFVRVVEFIKMQRSEDILDGDTEAVDIEINKAMIQFAVDRELLTEKRVEIAIRKAAATSLKLTPPNFNHSYQCLMYSEKLNAWANDGRKGRSPKQQVSSRDCWACPKLFRGLCIEELKKKEEETGPDRYILDEETKPKGI